MKILVDKKTKEITHMTHYAEIIESNIDMGDYIISRGEEKYNIVEVNDPIENFTPRKFVYVGDQVQSNPLYIETEEYKQSEVVKSLEAQVVGLQNAITELTMMMVAPPQ